MGGWLGAGWRWDVLQWNQKKRADLNRFDV
jgi:hypothetical protein